MKISLFIMLIIEPFFCRAAYTHTKIATLKCDARNSGRCHRHIRTAVIYLCCFFKDFLLHQFLLILLLTLLLLNFLIYFLLCILLQAKVLWSIFETKQNFSQIPVLFFFYQLRSEF